MNRMLNLVDHNLVSSMTLGFHSHNNLQLSYSNAVSMLQFPTNRDLIIDCSIMGMGKGAGNLNTELFLEHLNLYYGKKYNIAPLLEVIDTVLNQIKAEFFWGYSIEYYLSSINHCTPSYAIHFYKKHMLPVEQVAELLSLIDEDKKISFNRSYAEELYRKYNERKAYDDTKTINKLVKSLENKSILLIAPGLSINNNREKIECLLGNKNIISIALNMTELFDTDYVLTTRSEAFTKGVNKKKQLIVPSNICREESELVHIIDYKKWISINSETHDSSGVIALNLLKACNPKKVLLAGFDGFKSNINDNYYNIILRRPIAESEAKIRNKFYSKYILDMCKDLDIEFITKSIYEVID